MMLEKLSVVYVEDDDFMRENVARYLKRRVGTLHLATNGLEGLDMVMKKRPNIVITDIRMPKMNGLEMIQHIRKEYTKEALPIVVVSAYNDMDHHTDHADAYIHKPISLNDLYDVVKRLAKM